MGVSVRTALAPSAAAVVAALALAAEAVSAAPTVTLVPRSVSAGGIVSVSGAGWRPSGRVCGKALVQAYVPGVSPYALVRIASAGVGRDGRFSATWRTPAVTDRLAWRVEVRQTCRQPRRVLTGYATVTIG